MSGFQNISSAEDLKQAVIGKSNAQITREVVEAGIDKILQMVFMGMMMAFKANRAKGESAVIEYRIRALDRRIRYQVRVADGQLTVHPDGSAVPDLTLWVSIANFLRLVTNTMNVPLALLTLRLRMWGDREVAKKLARWF